jgi:hypothetical protein
MSDVVISYSRADADIAGETELTVALEKDNSKYVILYC